MRLTNNEKQLLKNWGIILTVIMISVIILAIFQPCKVKAQCTQPINFTCTPSITGDTLILPYQTYEYKTDTGMTGYFWVVNGGAILQILDNHCWIMWTSTTGIIRVNYLECSNPGVLIVGTTSIIEDKQPTISRDNIYYDMLGRTYFKRPRNQFYIQKKE